MHGLLGNNDKNSQKMAILGPKWCRFQRAPPYLAPSLWVATGVGASNSGFGMGMCQCKRWLQ